MKSLLPIVLVGTMVVSTGNAESAQGRKPIVLVAFGDSTTAPRDGVKIYANSLQSELKEKGLAVEVINAGVGGNSTEDARGRFKKDVLSRNPNLAIIQFGINDSTVNVWKNPPESKPPLSTTRYAANLEYFVESLRKQKCQVILMTPNPMRWTPALKNLYGKPPYFPDKPDGLNVTILPYVEKVRTLAKSKKVPLVDVYAAFQKYGESQSMDDLLLDGMHPNDKGHRLVADLLIEQILKSTSPTPVK